MRVLFVVNWYTLLSEKTLRSGVFHYEQCVALQEFCDIRLYWPFDEEFSELYQGVENGLYTYRSGGDLNNKAKWLRSTLKNMKKIISEFEPDLIHANVAYPSGLLCLLAAKKKMPVILTEHAPIEQMYLDNFVRKKIRHWVYKNTKKNICVSKDSRERLLRFFPDCEYEINYNAVMNPAGIQTDQNNYRKGNGINCAIVAAFYDKEIKGYQYLIPAIKKVNEMEQDTILHICGGGEYLQYYKELAKSIGIDDKCVFYDQCKREKVYSIVTQMDYCISSSIFECSGVSVQEEMLLGKPILVTRSGGANSLTTDYTAIVVDRNSTDALVNGIIEMNTKYQEFDSNRIKAYAFKNFEVSNVTKRYIAAYKEVIGVS